MSVIRVTLLIALVAAALACDQNRRGFPLNPTGPTVTQPTAGPPPPSIGHGTIAIRSISPAPGTAIPMETCPPGPSAMFTTLCTNAVHASIDVQADFDLAAASISIGFSDGARSCGVAWITRQPLAAGVTTSIDLPTVFLSKELSEGAGSIPQLVQPCQLPATTSRIVVQVWRLENAVTPVLAREFDRAYIFVEP
jgi:hypothetical protein